MFVVQMLVAFHNFIATTDVNGFLAAYYDQIDQELYGVPRWLQLSSKAWLAGDSNCAPKLRDFVLFVCLECCQ
jgi:hypothetical protein